MGKTHLAASSEQLIDMQRKLLESQQLHLHPFGVRNDNYQKRLAQGAQHGSLFSIYR